MAKKVKLTQELSQIKVSLERRIKGYDKLSLDITPDSQISLSTFHNNGRQGYEEVKIWTAQNGMLNLEYTGLKKLIVESLGPVDSRVSKKTLGLVEQMREQVIGSETETGPFQRNGEEDTIFPCVVGDYDSVKGLANYFCDKFKQK